MKLLLLNAIKGLRKKKIQMAGIIFMVMLSMAVYVGMNSAIDRLETRYYSYLEEQNVEDLSIGVAVDYSKDVSLSDLDYFLEHQFQNVTEEERALLEQYRLYLENPVYDVKMLYTIQSLFEKYEADIYLKTRILNSLKEEYQFVYEFERSKTVSDDKKLIKFLPYEENNQINQMYLIEGSFPKGENEIAILPGYAKKNHLKVGDTYTVLGENYIIVGFAYAPDYIYPLISFSMPIFDETNNNIAIVSETAYQKVVGVKDNSIALDYQFPTNRKFEITVSVGTEETETDSPFADDPVMRILDEDKIVMDINTITRLGRISALQMEFASNRLFAECFLYLLLTISVLIIVIITKKRIDDERLQIGVLKSLGYNRFSIAASYLVYPIVGSLVGGILGYIIGIIAHYPIANVLLSFYTVPLENYQLDLSYLSKAIFTPMISLSLLSYLIAIFMLRKKPLALLKEGSNLKVNLFSRIVNKINSLFPFHYRFKYSLAFRSLGKLLIVTITSFCTGLLIVLVLIGSNLFNHMIEESFAGIDYQYLVMLGQFDYKDANEYEEADYVLSVSVPLKEIKDKNGNIKSIEKEDEEIQFSLTGLDTTAQYVRILDKEEHNLIDRLDDDEAIIVNENAKELYNLEVGDQLHFVYETIDMTYTVVGFSSEFMGRSGYINREAMSTDLGLGNNAYTTIYSNQEKYESYKNLDSEEAAKIAYILNMNDMRENIEKQMDRFNGSIYIVIAFASIMVLVIISVIANIVVEENKKTISLLKVMGYKNRKISSMVLNIYTPFIIVAYLLSIPAMIGILKAIVNAIVGDIEITIPITISPIMAGIGLVGLLVAYYIAIGLSKRVLNKVPLAVALKRE